MSKTVEMTMMAGVGVVLLALSCAATAKVFGGVESGYASFSDFRAVTGERETISEGARYSAANLGAYRVIGGDGTTAGLIKLGLRHVRFDRSEQLGNEVLRGDAGLYHAFGTGTSLLVLGGWRDQRFEEEARDDRIASARLRLRQRFLWLDWQIEAHYEQGMEETLSGEYTGYGVGTALSWTPHSRWQFTLGAGVTRNAYEQSVTEIREFADGFLGSIRRESVETRVEQEEEVIGVSASVKRSFGRWFYVTGSGAHRRIEPSQGESLTGQSYSLALGVEF